MDEATATGVASNAQAMVAIDAIVDASVAEGIPRSAAMKLAAASLRSSSGLMLAGGMTPESLKESMSTSNGVTVNPVCSSCVDTRELPFLKLSSMLYTTLEKCRPSQLPPLMY